MSADIKVRQFIRKQIIEDAALLDLIGTAQLEHDISEIYDCGKYGRA
jgi:hypothetical protein